MMTNYLRIYCQNKAKSIKTVSESMIARILRLSIERRGVMMLFALFVAFFGMYSYKQLPIDAVPDITNVQIQINTQPVTRLWRLSNA